MPESLHGIPIMRQIQMPKPQGRLGKPVDREFYDLLGVTPSVTEKELKKAWRLKLKNQHPDKGGDPAQWTKISRAYQVLNQPETRACYDGFGAEFESVPNIELYQQHLKSPDLVVNVPVTLKQCLEGVENYEIKFMRNQDHVQKLTEHNFTIPKGVHNHHQLVFPDLGHQNKGKLPGTLVVVIKQLPNETFQRHGNVLFHRKSITLAEALMGGPVEICHPLGHTIYLKLSTGSLKTGVLYEIPGQGGTPEWSMYVDLELVLPDLDDSQKQRLTEVLGYTTPILPAKTITISPVETTKDELQEAVEKSLEDKETERHESTAGPERCPMQ